MVKGERDPLMAADGSCPVMEPWRTLVISEADGAFATFLLLDGVSWQERQGSGNMVIGKQINHIAFIQGKQREGRGKGETEREKRKRGRGRGGREGIRMRLDGS